ncbi:MAG: 50S ribosomal protein L4 [Patescibacteria group bacterium]|mgnify:CR=1 FL=1
MEAKVYNQQGKETGTTELPAEIFALPWNNNLVRQVVTSMESNQRTNRAHAKGRGEVRGGGKKPWRQKGTGRSRHGSIRSPLWRGGGATHGPTNERNYFKKVNKKAKLKARLTILSAKHRDKEVIFLDKLDIEGKTKNALGVLKNLSQIKGFEKIGYQTGNRAILALPTVSQEIRRGFKNIKSALVKPFAGVSPIDLLRYQFVVIVEPALSIK